ncbi:ImmA/IrrE family metallo-endopeptidase [Zhenpiania hominis]|uniref:ImmA/IrrE family metallo-endopeptidase n=1 Tax=Zhenpiania hominis TaxID=2763644 RepID=UPI0039F493EA
MGQTIRYEVKRDVLLWAIKESQKSINDIELKFSKINEWINGDSAPTMKQIESLANFLKIPFGYMFLATPPKTNVMKVEFRSIDNKLPEVSKNLKDTLLEMDRNQSWMSELRQELGWDKLDIIKNFDIKVNDKATNVEVAKLAKKLLGLEEEWYLNHSTNEKAYNYLREKLEDAGILVMQNGVVGFDTHRKLELNEFRAFMLYDDYAPLIFVNGTDSTAGKIFSLMHEFVHILYQQDDIISESSRVEIKANERKINQIASEVLIPQEVIKAKWIELENKEELARIDTISKMLKVSSYAVAVKLSEMRMIADNIVAVIASRSQNIRRSTSGGDFYKNYYAKMSSNFLKSVVSQTESGNLSYTYAFKLLGGIKGNVYNQIRGEIYG